MAIAETLGVTEGEVVMAFPKGKEARGYYNSMGKPGDRHCSCQ